MSTSSIAYLAFLLLAVSVFTLAGGAGRRRIAFGAASAVFLSFFVASRADAAFLALFVLGGFAAARLAGRREGSAVVPLGALVLVPVAVLLVVKRYAFLGWIAPRGLLAHGLEVVGLSYMSFKLIHVLVDARQGALAPVSLPCFIAYQLGFPTLTAGPIQRYGDFARWWEDPAAPPDARQSLLAWDRLFNGVLKAGLGGTLLLHAYTLASDALLAAHGREALAGFLVAFYAYPLYVYLNFSGYCDIVIASGRLLGLTLPENFDSPFRARDMIDFWNRWHISLTHWIRDYVFMSSYKSVASRWPALKRPAGYAALFAALFIAGVWHGSTWNFVLFGAANGLGVMAAEIYADGLRRRLGPDGLKRYLQNAWLRRAAVTVTFHYVCFCFLFFPSDLRKTALMVKSVAAALGLG